MSYPYPTKVVHIPTKKIYDFGYIGATGRAVVYDEGACNMQDSHAFSFDDIRLATLKDLE